MKSQAQDTLVSPTFFVTFILVSRDYACNNSLKDNLGLSARMHLFDMLCFWKYALNAFLRSAPLGRERAPEYGYKVVN